MAVFQVIIKINLIKKLQLIISDLGLDMAYIFNGYVYHTEYDLVNIFPKGALQNTGDNVLALAKALANAPEMEDTSVSFKDL